MRKKKPQKGNFLARENCNTKKCKSCIFRTDGKQLILSPGRMSEIQAYLGTGQSSHICHNTERTCYGALEYQAMIFYRIGLIKEESVDCLLDTAKKYLDKNDQSLPANKLGN